MSEQPVPDSGYALDDEGDLWVRGTDGWHCPVHELAPRPWEEVDLYRGPMTPLLPAVRPDRVPDDAVPFVGWVAREAREPRRMNVHMPNGVLAATYHIDRSKELGLPIPTAPAPSLPERLRSFTSGGDYPEGERWVAIPADLRDEILDALEGE